MYKFLHPYLFFLLLLPLCMLLLPAVKDRPEAIRTSAAGTFREICGKRRRRTDGIIRRCLLFLVWVLAVCAVCGPVYVPEPETSALEKRNVLLAMDISLSMDTRDWKDSSGKKTVSRWEAEREMAGKLIKARDGDSFACVVFGSEAYLIVPFTQDPDVIVRMLEKTQAGMAGNGTSIGNATGVACRHFASDSVSDRIMILITDGLDTGEGVSPLEMAEIAARDSVKIYTIALGSPEEGFANVDHRLLERISGITGGKSYMAKDMDTLGKIMDDINAEEPVIRTVSRPVPEKPLFHIPLSLAAALLCLYLLSSELKRRRI